MQLLFVRGTEPGKDSAELNIQFCCFNVNTDQTTLTQLRGDDEVDAS